MCGLKYQLFILLSMLAGSPTPHSNVWAQETQAAHKYTNELIHSSSPYLLQHAHNPVNWLPWGPEAFAKAKRENKPIFVSIGYSTCYWCHVMERESFEDESIAAILNEHYVAIKVDREQRPDIDEQLMLATQLMTGRGGWPNSVWLTSDGRPWMTGTYFPRPQFADALQQLATIWRNQADAVQKQADSLAEAIRSASRVQVPTTSSDLTMQPLDRALAELEQLFDAQHGGFGSKPKFPPHGVLQLLSYAARHDTHATAEAMLTSTLNAMWRGGIHDHIGGGFHRYSTDERWFLPHFEKMLYDNAQLMRAYAEAYEITKDENYRHAVKDIYAWLMREMADAQGGFYSALDSESDGEEGRFNTWSLKEIEEVLSKAEAERFIRVYNLEAQGNFSEEATGERPGTNILFLRNATQSQEAEQLADLRDKLLAARNQRVYPHLDDKVLTSWNGLMISSLAFAARTLDDNQLAQAATHAAEFLLRELRNPDGSLLHMWRRGDASVPAYLDDYAFLIDGLLELHAASGDDRWLKDARALADEMLERFEDSTDGGFYFTGPQHEQLLVRSKNLLGGGNLPSGNGIAIQVLVKLFQQTGEAAYLNSARRGLQAFSELMLKSPRQVEHIVLANALYLDAIAATPPGKDPAQSESLQADATAKSQALSVSLFLSHAQRAPNQSLAIAVRVQINQAYHLYGPPPTTEAEADDSVSVQASSLELVPQPGLTAGKLQLPAGETRRDPVLGQSVTSYAGTVWFYLPVEVLADAPLGPREVSVQLKYQACDATRCLLPQTLTLSAPVIISDESSNRRKHAEVFKQWDAP